MRMHWIADFWLDVRYAMRTLRRQLSFTATVVVVLGVTIGLNASLFTVVAGLLLRPWSGVAEPSEVRRIYLNDPTGRAAGFSLSDSRTLAGRTTSFAGIGSMRREFVRVGAKGEDTSANALMTSGNLLDVLGVKPKVGRLFALGEDRIGDPKAVVILGHHFWQSRFGGTSAVLGTPVSINGASFTVIGVAPREFANSEPGYDTQVFIPISALTLLRPDDPTVALILNDTKSCCADLVGRLHTGFTEDQARAELEVLASGFSSFSATPARGVTLTTTAFGAQPGRGDSTQAFLMATLLAGALLLVWLIACANVGNLVLARAAERLREMSTRLALGSTRGRLVRQLLAEGFVLAMAASALGVAVSGQLPQLVFRIVAGSGKFATLPFSVTPDAWVLTYAIVLGGFSVTAFGLAPALMVSRAALRSSMSQTGGLADRRIMLRQILLSVEVAVSVILLVGAGLLVRGVQRQAGTFDPGLELSDVSVVSFGLPEATYDRARTIALFTEVEAAARGVAAKEIAFASHDPFSQYPFGTLFHLPGQTREQAVPVSYVHVTHEYLKLLRIPLVSGRYFERPDSGRPSAIVNEAMAARYWPGENPVGKTFMMRPRGPVDEMVAHEVIGVVRNVRASVFNVPQPMFYRAITPGNDVLDFISNDPRASQPPVLLIKGPATAAEMLVPAVARLDSRVRVRSTRLSEAMNTMLASARWGPIVATTLGLFALGLATVGMFGVFTYSVRQRTQEIGIRMALGARPSAILRLVLASHSKAVVAGLVAGLLGGASVSRALVSRLHGLSPFDPVTYFGVGLVLSCCAVAATWVAARQITRILPIHSLRSDLTS